MDLTVIWAFIIAFAVFAYVVMDGFDLGIGILFPTFAVGRERDRAMNSIAPVWDGNETWLVLGGGGLFAAFPLAYAVILPATYPLIIAMLLGLVFRGVAFEYRWRDPAHRAFWDAAFTGGSLVAALAQGMTLGALLQGIEVVDRAYAGSWFDWFTPYTLLTGLGTVAGYALLGGTWLIWKLDGEEQAHARRLAVRAGIATIVLMGAVSLYNIGLKPEYAARWLTAPEVYWVAPVPIVTAIVAVSMLRAILKDRNSKPFWLGIALFFLGMSGLGVTIWPYVVPPGVTIWDAAAPERSQIFMLVGVAITMPLIIGYTVWAYWVFRGKVADEGYH
ncbi:cytochrome d ubiquinol oxidase subunit II [Erythrobacter sanguineus]|jgi:cytochrome bd ubiquinol oxidase subunit II|uniref:Cytochrome bd-I ubiquinol oxidase subunit 2 apoprotein n=1 Tax=Erythrobacter sanguineus TaxID=198312 RepID=A0A1M7S3V6_9SPHN|nr:cytochrome d ubiquinol oxidase subunit II [Erythrobacter sanguineus]SHN53136.1 cytochrome bd-I ubiquinol oxidase subunit 2 apoprotein [Erythrobacter sanguineus]